MDTICSTLRVIAGKEKKIILLIEFFALRFKFIKFISVKIMLKGEESDKKIKITTKNRKSKRRFFPILRFPFFCPYSPLTHFLLSLTERRRMWF